MRGTSRVGTIEDSYYSIKNRIDMLEDDGKIRVKTFGESPDGKVTNEFHIYQNNQMDAFTIYDYKFGFDPSDEEHFMEEYSFSVGGKSQNALESAKAYARQPEKIASKVYANRMGNGDEASKEGFKYAGKGYIQLTGKANYMEFDKTVPEDIINNPELVATKYPLASAAWFWSKNGLNLIADKGATDLVVTSVTKRVNGGTIGLEDRIKHFKEFYALLA